MSSSLFISFEKNIPDNEIPKNFTIVKNNTPHPLCLLAAKKIQTHLKTQTDWQHNFGLDENQEGTIIGKMFGVLIVKNQENKIGYLAAFSGKLAGGNHHNKFVPPVFDGLTEGSFVNEGMIELTNINQEIKKLEENLILNEPKIADLKTKRKNHSTALQNKIFDHYSFLNKNGKEKSLRQIFEEEGYKNPPVAAGECAGPKLLQYAFQNKLQPLAIAEFCWGQSPKSVTWVHEKFYPCCKEKCEPILKHMLDGLK